MLEALEDRAGETILRLTVGILDALPKLAAHRLLQPVMGMASRCASSVTGRDRRADVGSGAAPARRGAVGPAGGQYRQPARFSHPLGEYPVSFLWLPALARQYAKGFPASLSGAP